MSPAPEYGDMMPKKRQAQPCDTTYLCSIQNKFVMPATWWIQGYAEPTGSVLLQVSKESKTALSRSGPSLDVLLPY